MKELCGSESCPVSLEIKSLMNVRLQWLTPVILATQEAGIRRITVGSQLNK
jgi:hypothetical protein